MRYLAYFAVGCVMDALITLYYLAISSRRAVAASLLGTLITWATYKVLEAVIISRDDWLILAYALGTGLGTWAAIRFRRGKGA